MKKKSSKNNHLITFCVYLIVIAIICSIIFIYYFQKKLGSGLIKCAEDELNHLMSLIMNNCIHEYLENTPNLEIIKIERNNNQEIKRITYDTKVLNKTRTQIIDRLETDLDYMTEGKLDKIGVNLNKLSDEYYQKTTAGILFTISIGSATGNYFFANIGPKIPINLKTIGDATADINTKITEYGMNNALIEVNIELEATTIIHMPFLSKEVKVKNIIPLTMEIIQGTVPNYYLSNGVN